MYQEILNALKAKFTGVSDAVLGRIAKNLAKTATTPEQVKAAVDGTTLQQVIDGYADSRATEATQTAVHNYETKWGLKDGAKVDGTGGEQTSTNPTTTQNTAGDAEQTPEWAKSLMEQNKALADRLSKMEGERITTNRRQQISSVTAKLPETFRKAYERIAVDTMSDEEFNTLLAEVTTEVDGIASGLNTKGAVFGRPGTTNVGNGGDGLTKEQEAAITQRGAATGEQPF